MKPRDEIWDELESHFGEVRTKSERGRRNAAVRELRAAAATPAEIQVAVAYCREHFTSFHEVAVCNWLSRALHENGKSENVRGIFDRMKGVG